VDIDSLQVTSTFKVDGEVLAMLEIEEGFIAIVDSTGMLSIYDCKE